MDVPGRDGCGKEVMMRLHMVGGNMVVGRKVIGLRYPFCVEASVTSSIFLHTTNFE